MDETIDTVEEFQLASSWHASILFDKQKASGSKNQWFNVLNSWGWNIFRSVLHRPCVWLMWCATNNMPTRKLQNICSFFRVQWMCLIHLHVSPICWYKLLAYHTASDQNIGTHGKPYISLFLIRSTLVYITERNDESSRWSFEPPLLRTVG